VDVGKNDGTVLTIWTGGCHSRKTLL
jgi:hypothetical protein